jgi:hypothetical protein
MLLPLNYMHTGLEKRQIRANDCRENQWIEREKNDIQQQVE